MSKTESTVSSLNARSWIYFFVLIALLIIFYYAAPTVLYSLGPFAIIFSIVRVFIANKRKTPGKHWVGLMALAILLMILSPARVKKMTIAETTYAKGVTALEKGNFEGAIEHLKQAGDYEDARALVQKARIENIKKVHQNYIAKLNVVEAKVPNDPISALGDSEALLSKYKNDEYRDTKSKKVQSKVSEIEKACLAQIAASADSFVEKAKVTFESGGLDEARMIIELVIRSKPEHEAAAVLIQQIQLRQQEEAFASARSLLKQKNYSKAVEILRSLTGDFAKRKDVKKALKGAEKALAKAEHQAEVRKRAAEREAKLAEWGGTLHKRGKRIKFDGVEVRVSAARTKKKCVNKVQIFAAFEKKVITAEDNGYFVIVDISEKNISNELETGASNTSGFSMLDYRLVDLDGSDYRYNNDFADCMTKTADIDNPRKYARLYYDVRTGKTWKFKQFFAASHEVSKADLYLEITEKRRGEEPKLVRVPLF